MKTSPFTFAGALARCFLLLCAISFGLASARAADHGDSPSSSNNGSADLGDLYFYLDPNDNSRAILEITVRGFIVPGEAVNMAIFDPEVIYRYQVEGTGDANPDATIDVTFSQRTSTTVGQTATVRMIQGSTQVFAFTAPATPPSLRPAPAPTQVVTTDPASSVNFFAGEVDDPFFFDIPGFGRFVASVLGGTPNPATFDRARDTFSGYNTMAIALSMPKSLLPSTNNVVGLSATTFRIERAVTNLGNLSSRGRVTSGENVLIGGLIVTGPAQKRLIVRGIGSSLTAKGVAGALSNPKLTLRDSQAQVVATNNNWQDTQATEITASGLAPTDANEAAIIATLPPGNYTAIVEGEAADATGLALVEVYDLENGSVEGSRLRQIDREGVPGVNVVTIPAARKDEYNSATTQDDAAGRFAPTIIATLKSLGTNDANIGILASVAVVNGDFLRLNLNTANTGTGGGTNAAAAFPNGRRLGDDVIDTLLSLVTNQSGITDKVNANDLVFANAFPFFALSQQPRDSGVDDNTRN